jgi:hypothetical protein
VRFNFEIDREIDGRWIAEIPEIAGALAYGTSEGGEAKARAYPKTFRNLSAFSPFPLESMAECQGKDVRPL